MRKVLLWCGAVALLSLLATAITSTFTHERFELESVRISTLRSVESNGCCPLSEGTTSTKSTWLIEICGSYGLFAFEAARQYPSEVAKIFGLYGRITPPR